MALLDVSIHTVHSYGPDQFPITIEAVEAHSGMPAYYRIDLAGVRVVITDAHRRQILDCLASAPPLPKSDAQIDAEREDSAYAIGQGDCEVLRG
jgi:hypothetical protein